MSLAITPLNSYKNSNKNNRKRLFLQKICIDSKENLNYKQHLDRLFTDPNLYFEDKYNGNQIVIGKKESSNSKRNQLAINHQMTNRKSIYQKNQLKVNTSRSLARMSDKSGICKPNKDLSNNKFLIDDNELKDIFDKARELKNKNLLLNKIKTRHHYKATSDLIKEFNKTSKIEMRRILTEQENALTNKNSKDIKIKRVAGNVAKKIKRNEEDLLMNQTEIFRIKKDFKSLYSKEIESKTPQPPYKWVTSLRDNYSNHYINFGSLKNPTWQLITFPHIKKETIINPGGIVDFSRTDFNFFTREGYLQNKLSLPIHEKIKDKMSMTMTVMNELSVKGKDLLQFEIDHAKCLKGKKVMTKKNDDNIGVIHNLANQLCDNYMRDRKEEDVIIENVDSKELFCKKSIK